jgi:D-3-phosphoglycerate dehydrogenase / 2-oxoglutarate reductase
MPVVLIAQPIADEGVALLTTAGFEVRQLPRFSRDALLKEITEAHGLLVRNAQIDREVIEAAPLLRVISRHGAGLDTIDLEAADEHAIQVTYTPTANGISVAEHILGMIIGLAKNMRLADQAVRRGHFDFRHERYGLELQGSVLGIVGLGNVGGHLARMASQGFGMKVMAFDPFVASPPADLPVEMASSLEELLGVADFVSLNLALSEQTEGLIGGREIGLMKAGSYLINCARSQVVVEEALIEALQSGHLAGAGVDVYSSDPPADDCPLFALENALLTPHMAAHTDAAMKRMAVHAAQGLIEVLTEARVTWPANQLTSTERLSI